MSPLDQANLDAFEALHEASGAHRLIFRGSRVRVLMDETGGEFGARSRSLPPDHGLKVGVVFLLLYSEVKSAPVPQEYLQSPWDGRRFRIKDSRRVGQYYRVTTEPSDG